MKFISTIKQNYGIILIVLVGIFLRFYHLGFQSAWLDEVLVLKESDSDSLFSVMYDAVLLRDSTSFLHIFSIHYLGQIWDHNIFVARFISAFAGVLSIYYIYKLGILMLNKRVGYIAAILLTLNLFHIEYSQEARSYALLVLFVIIAFYKFYQYLYNPTLLNAVYLGVFMGLISNAHPIGLLNVVSIFVILFFVFCSKKDWKSRISIIKGGTIAGIFMLLVFSIIFPIVLAASKIKSFWITKASFERVVQVFTEISGRSIVFLWLYIVAFLYFTIQIILLIKHNRKGLLENKLFLSYLVLVIWFGLEVAVILIKSFTGVSILLSRYMIAILPAMVLFLAISIDLIKSKLSKYIIVVFIVGFSVYNTFFDINYYNTVSKAQFKETADFINRRNHLNDKVVSRYGYVVSYYINKGNAETEVVESSLNDFIDAMKNKSIAEASFWYFDGNSADYIVSPENQIFLDETFRLKENKISFDCWAKHYVMKNQAKVEPVFKNGMMQLPFKDFKPLNVDAKGNMYMFEKSTIKSKRFSIPVGQYTLILNGNSLPEIPIEGQNAHLIVRVDDKIIGDFYLSEKQNQTLHELKFEVLSAKPIVISIDFINDIAIGELDRNVILYNAKIQK